MIASQQRLLTSLVRRLAQGRLPRKCFLSSLDETHLVYTDKSPPDYDGSATVYANVVSKEEESILLQDLQQIFKRRRYERGHWDAVIVKYKETELYNEMEQLSATSQKVLKRIRLDLVANGHVRGGISWLPSHAIELHPEGELRAHVDSVRFSGNLVAGLSLGTASIMRLQPAKKEEDAENKSDNVKLDHVDDTENGYVDLLLHPRSLYTLTGCSRYDYTHELLPSGSTFEGTGECIVRDGDRVSIIFRDSKEAE